VGEDHTGEPQANHERLTVAQAATRLGITEGAVRSRIKRGTLRTAKEGRTVYVLLGDGTPQANQPPNTGVPGDQSELVASLQDQVSYLREQLDVERQARTEERRRHDTVVAQLTSKIPALEAPQEASEDAETVEEAPDELGAERARREMAESTLREGMAEERRRREEAERERDELRRELHAHGRQQEAAETVEEAPDRAEPRSATGEPQGGEQAPRPRPWWRRWFG
jgi:hypothetical protein